MSVIAFRAPRHASPERSAPHAVALAALDPAFRAAVPTDQLKYVQRFTADVHTVTRGPWAAHEETHGHQAFAWLCLDGLLCQEVSIGGRPSAELFGPGDVIRPWQPEPALPSTIRWTCIDTARVAILDQRFVAAARRWPGLMTVIFERLTDQLQTAQHRTAIAGLPRVEQRVLALFWQLADRWGIVRPEGVVIRLALTHEFLGHLIAAKRPTVSLALAALAADNLLTRDNTGNWLLAHHSIDELRPTPCHRPDVPPHRRVDRSSGASAARRPTR